MIDSHCKGAGVVITNESENYICYQTNLIMNKVLSPSWITFEAKNSDGAYALCGLLLPPDYIPNKNYLTVVYVYPGMTREGVFGILHSHMVSPFADLRVLASHGYKVFIPSLPLHEDGRIVDYITNKLKDDIVAILDHAEGGGYVNIDRLFVMGDSYGGFAVA